MNDSSVSDSARLQIMGLPVDGYTYPEWLDQIAAWLRERDRQSPRHICTLNPEFVVIASRDAEFYRVLANADALVPDGIGIMLAARWLGHPLPERITGSDGIFEIAQRAARNQWRLYLLGAAPGIARQTAAKLETTYPGLRIAGTYAGSPADDEADDIIALINQSRADILLVAYGAPQQDLWIDRHRDRLKVKVAIGVGGAFDYVVGVAPRAPQWLRRIGLEWLYRLVRQPWRWRRMLRLPVFVWLVLRHGTQTPRRYA